VANPSVTGWTTKDLIEKELPIFDKVNSNVCTLLIGVNDWVQEVSPEDFGTNLKLILDHLQNGLTDPKRILIINIPDFSVTPEGPQYNKGRDISEGLIVFNKIIEKEAKQRELPLVDLFTVSKEMEGKPDLIAKDKLHPSAKTYKRWKELIQPTFQKLLKL
jgi:lysophospholipase L1-like esterase